MHVIYMHAARPMRHGGTTCVTAAHACDLRACCPAHAPRAPAAADDVDVEAEGQTIQLFLSMLEAQRAQGGS
jgi:hypothetical protein